MRVDANVPIRDGAITDDGRIRAFLPTLHAVLEQGARVVLASHLGRPETPGDPKYTLAPVAHRLAELTGLGVHLALGCDGESLGAALAAAGPADIVMLENLRYDPRETSSVEKKRQELAWEWSQHVSFVVEDGFGVVHRKQASVYDLPGMLPSVAGLLVEREVEVVTRLTKEVEHPYTVVLGGSKVSDKLGVIEALVPMADSVLIGGGLVFTVLQVLGHPIGKSLVETSQLEVVKDFLDTARSAGVDIVLPHDIVMASGFSADADTVVLGIEDLESGPDGGEAMGLDIGPSSAEKFARIIQGSQTVFWNGPMGVFEFEAFQGGTKTVADALSAMEGLSVVGGGDSAAAVRLFGFDESSFSHISTGGGASLEFLEGKVLPGLEILGWQA
jgi:phosphoglycerate kinase